MKIAVCMKQVPSTAGPLQLDAASCWIREADSAFEANAADVNALEEALRIKDKTGAEVVAISLGPDRVAEILREALAKGADRAIHVVLPDSHALDPRELARILADTLHPNTLQPDTFQANRYDLVFAGLQSDDHGYGQVGVALAEYLGLPHVSIVAEMLLGENGQVRVRRELEGGWFQWMELPLPCVLTIQSGINKSRYAGIKGMLAAKKKTLERILAIVPEVIARQSAEQLYLPYKTKETRMLTGSPEDMAAALIDTLNLRARLR